MLWLAARFGQINVGDTTASVIGIKNALISYILVSIGFHPTNALVLDHLVTGVFLGNESKLIINFIFLCTLTLLLAYLVCHPILYPAPLYHPVG